MANKHRAEVPVILDGDTYVLRYDMNTIPELEERMGDKPFGLLLSAEHWGMKATRAALWIGITGYKGSPHRRLNEKQIGAMMNGEDYGQYIEAILKAIAYAFGQEPEDFANQPEEKADPLPQAAAG